MRTCSDAFLSKWYKLWESAFNLVIPLDKNRNILFNSLTGAIVFVKLFVSLLLNMHCLAVNIWFVLNLGMIMKVVLFLWVILWYFYLIMEISNYSCPGVLSSYLTILYCGGCWVVTKRVMIRLWVCHKQPPLNLLFMAHSLFSTEQGVLSAFVQSNLLRWLDSPCPTNIS